MLKSQSKGKKRLFRSVNADKSSGFLNLEGPLSKAQFRI